MPIGVVSDDDFAKEIESLGVVYSPTVTPTELVPTTEEPLAETPEQELITDFTDLPEYATRPGGSIVTLERGRGLGNKAVPQVLRNVLAQDAIESGSASAKSIARAFDVSDSSLAAYKHNAHSTSSYHTTQPELKKVTDHTREVIGKKARSRLLSAINHITPEKLADAKLRDIAGVAQAMSAVIKNIDPPAEVSAHANVNIVLFAPRVRSEEAYEVVQVQE